MAPSSDDSGARGVHAAALKQATAVRHRRVEQRLDVRTMFASLEAYRAALERLLGFHRPLERPLAAAAVTLEPPLPPVARAQRLADDLHVLGADPAAVAQCHDLPHLEGAARVVGVLYVVEGSALGGAVLARLAERRLNLGRTTGAAFFTGDAGPAAEQRWATVLGLVESQGAAGALPEVIAGAADAFDRLDDWLGAAQPLGGNVAT